MSCYFSSTRRNWKTDFGTKNRAVAINITDHVVQKLLELFSKTKDLEISTRESIEFCKYLDGR